MPLEDFIIWTYCWVDDHLKQLTTKKPLRRRGFAPKLSDAEMITMELIGEFQGIDGNKPIWEYFKSHWHPLFPAIGSRSQFAKQAQNLWAAKQWLQQQLSMELGSINDPVHIIDGFPIKVSHFKRAKQCQCFKGVATYGYCASKDETYLGFEGHLLVDLRGVIAGFALTPAHESEREVTWELIDGTNGQLLLGDKGYLGEFFQNTLFEFTGVQLETPVRHNMTDPMPKSWRKQLNRLRRRVETTIGQLVERFNIQKNRARTLWSLTNRLTRKLLSHSLAVLANIQRGVEPLQLEKTVTV